ncbi:ER lumen protein retaining receptor [Nematocida sp. LUAm3]|nr:ER lumen protein retaining receptor [Nematocida sp. LUAm3]KAI5174630.1 ER lumen protein retaining receptor [Nematocida sp. LUAm2]KAI5177964.1 ER lumen protein retaining receptor [Nematocida sp. LUAm1]
MGTNILLSGAEGLVRTTGDVLHGLSMVILLMKMNRTRSCSGISLKSQFLYLSVYLLRYLDLIYLFIYPSFVLSSPRLVYNTIMKVFFIGIQSVIIYRMVYRYYYSYDSEFDDTPMIMLIGIALFGGAVLISSPKQSSLFLMHLTLNWLWASSIILESVSIVPQLVLLHRAGEGESLTVYYVVFMGMYRVFYIFAWIIKWINTGVLSQMLLWSSIVQTVLYSDFFMVYFQSFVAKGKTLRIYPTTFLREAFGLQERKKN